MRLPFRSLATTLLAIGVATCSDTPIASVKNGTTPAKSTLGRVAFGVSFSKSASLIASQLAASGNDFDNVHLSIRDLHDTTVVVKDTTFGFSATGPDSVVVTLDVPVQTDGQEFNAGLDFQRGSVVLFHGSAVVHSFLPGSTPPPPPVITTEYVGPGTDATRLVLAPQSVTLDQSTSVTFAVTAFNAANTQVDTPPISWSVSDPTIASITSSGTISGRGRRGTVVVTATFGSASGQASATFTLPPAAIAVVSGAGQTGRAGSTLPSPAIVQVTTSDGVGVGGVSVVFGAPAGGSASPATAVTDATGRVSTNLTLGSVAGPQSFVATAAGFSAAIGETATANVASTIAIVAGNNQTDSIRKVLAPLSVKVTDQFGNPVAGASVGWTRASGTGALASASSTSGADGVATNTYTLGNVPGAESVTASVGSTPAASVTFSFTTRSGGASAIVPVSGDAQTVRAGEAVASPLVVRVTDAANNPVAGATVTWTATAGTVAPATSTTDATGQASATFTAGLATGQGFAVAHLGNAIVNFTMTIRPGATTQLAFTTQPTNGNAGAALAPVVVTLRDAGGNTVTTSSDPVTIALGANTAGATLSGTLTRNAVNGVATFNDLRLDKVGTAFTLVATSGAFHATSNAFNTVLGTAAHIQIVGPTSLSFVAGTTPTTIPSFLVTDASGNPVPNFSFQLSLAEIVKGVALTQGDSTVTTDGTGQVSLASLVLKASQAGSYVLTATATGLTGSPITLPVTITPGAPAALVFTTGPSSAAAAALMSPVTVSITDTFGNVIPGATNSVTIALAPNTFAGVLSGTTTAAAVNGVATFSNLSIDRIGGSYQLTASATNLLSALSQPFSITASAPTHLTILTQPPTSTVAGATLPTIRVAIEDAGNNVVGATNSITLTLAPNPGSATLGGTTTQAAQNGVATFNGLTVDKAGIGYGILASVVGSTTILPASTNSFTVTSNAPTKMVFLTPPSNVVAGAVETPSVVVQLQDASGNLASGATNIVSLNIVSGPGTTINGGTVQAVNGVAVFTSASFPVAGTYVVSALSGSLTPPTSVTINVTAGGVATLVPSSLQTVIAQAGSALTSAPTVTAKDGSGNPIPGTAITVTVRMAGSGNLALGVTPTVLTTNAQGMIALNDLPVSALPTVMLSYLLELSDGGAPFVDVPLAITAATASKIVLVTPLPTTVTSGAPSLQTPTFLIEDTYGNSVAASRIVTASVPLTSGVTLSGNTADTTSVGGVGSFTGLVVTGPSGPVTLTLSSSGIASASWTPTIVQPAAATLQLVDGTTHQPLASAPTIPMTAGVAPVNPPVVLVTSAAGQPVPNDTMIVTAVGHHTPSFNLAAITGPDGTASFVGASLVTADTFAVTIHQGSLAQLTGTVLVSPAAANHLQFGPAPTGVTAGTATRVKVYVVDQFNNVVQSGNGSADSITVNVVSGPGTLTFNGIRPVNGVATMASFLFNAAGTYVLNASSIGLAGSLSSVQNLTVTVAAPTITAVGPTFIATAVATPVSQYPSIRLVDGGGNPLSNQAVSVMSFGECTLPGGAVFRKIPGRVPTLQITPRRPALRDIIDDSVTVRTDANGIASLSSSTLSIPVSAAGSCLVEMYVPSATAALVRFVVLVRPTATTPTWTGAASSDWTNGANWFGGVAPGPSDPVFIPSIVGIFPSVYSAPTLTADAAIGSLTIEDFGVLDLGAAHVLTVTGSVDANTLGSITNGVLLATGGGVFRGLQFPSTVLGSTTSCATFAISGTLWVNGNLTLNCGATIDNAIVEVIDDLNVQNSGYLGMQNGGQLVVDGNATFDGVPGPGMTGGVITFRKDFTQLSTHNNPASFAPSGSNFNVYFSGAGVIQHASFATPASSSFANVGVTNNTIFLTPFRSTSAFTVMGGTATFADTATLHVLVLDGATSLNLTKNIAVAADLDLGEDAAITSVGAPVTVTVGGQTLGYPGSDFSGIGNLISTFSAFPILQGPSPANVILAAPTTLSTSGSITGNLRPRAALSILGPNVLSIVGNLYVNSDSGGSIAMSNAGAILSVGGTTTFAGGATNGGLTGGTVELKGDLVEDEATPSALQGTGLKVQFHGGVGTQNVTFTHPGNALAHFDIVEVTSPTLQFNSDALVKTSLDVLSQGGVLVPEGRTLTIRPGVLRLHSNSSLTADGTVTPTSCQRNSGSGVTAAINGPNSAVLSSLCVALPLP